MFVESIVEGGNAAEEGSVQVDVQIWRPATTPVNTCLVNHASVRCDDMQEVYVVHGSVPAEVVLSKYACVPVGRRRHPADARLRAQGGQVRGVCQEGARGTAL